MIVRSGHVDHQGEASQEVGLTESEMEEPFAHAISEMSFALVLGRSEQISDLTLRRGGRESVDQVGQSG